MSETELTEVVAGNEDNRDDWQTRLIEQILNSLPSLNSRRSYAFAISQFLEWGRINQHTHKFDRAGVFVYREHLQKAGQSASTLNVRLSAIKKLAREARYAGRMGPETEQGIRDIPGIKDDGVRTGNWLTAEQANRLILLPDTKTPIGIRDRALLGILLGCGLRRDEAATLAWGKIQKRDGHDCIVDLKGKGGRTRSVGIQVGVRAFLDVWKLKLEMILGPESVTDKLNVFRPINKAGYVTGENINGHTVYQIVRKYASILGVPFAPHDLRRTTARQAREAGMKMQSLQAQLGHQNSATTERYLGVHEDLSVSLGDWLDTRIQH